MPIPDRHRLLEYALKGANLGLRSVGQAPEQRRARRLAAQHDGPLATGSPHVVIVTPRDWSAQVNWEAMIGHALRLREARVSFITCGGELEVCDRANHWEAPPMPCGTCRHYVQTTLKAHGFPTYPLRDAWQVDDPGGWPELDKLGFDDLSAVHDELGVPLGSLTDIPLKWFLMTGSVHDDPLASITWRRFLRAGRKVARAFDRRLDELQPDVVLLLNGLFFFESIAWELCRRRGIDVVTYERGFREGTLVFRRGVAACLMDLSPQWQEVAEAPLPPDQRRRIAAFLEARGVQIDAPDVPGHDEPGDQGRRVVLFTNLTWDSAVIGQERAFPSLKAWITAAIEAFEQRPQDELVIRIHPAEVTLPGKQSREYVEAFIQATFPSLPRNIRVVPPDSTESSYDLMRWSDVGLVFTSTTGLELAISGRPVLVAGETHYRDKGFTIDLDTADEFLPTLERVLQDPRAFSPDRERAMRYAKLLFLDAPIDTLGVVEPVPGLAEIIVDELHEISPGANVDFDAVCDGILRGGDFVARDRTGALG